jgi:hypothetical protein
MEKETRAIIRDANTGSDHAFLYSSWRNALWFAEKRDPKASDLFYKEASEYIAALLKDPEAKIRIACLSDDPDMLLGWSLMRGDHLEFVYVKIDYRRKGIGRILTHDVRMFSPPQTKIGKSLAEKFLKEKPYGRKEEIKTQPD